jgi:hypothetical protein
MRTERVSRGEHRSPLDLKDDEGLLDPEILEERPETCRIRVEAVNAFAHPKFGDGDVQRVSQIVLENEPLCLSVVGLCLLGVEGSPALFQKFVQSGALVIGEVQTASG